LIAIIRLHTDFSGVLISVYTWQ